MNHSDSFRFPYSFARALGVALLGAVLANCGGGDSDSTPPPPPTPTFGSVQVVSGNAQTGVVGAELGAQLVARVLDRAGSPMPGYPATFVVVTGEGTVFTGATTSAANGELRERWTLGPGTGVQSVEVRGVNASGAPGVLAQFTALATSGQPATAEADLGTNWQTAQQTQPLPSPLAVLVRDVFGNARAGVTVAFAPCATCGSVTAASSITNANGEAQTSWTLGVPVGDQTLVATVAGLPDVEFTATAMRAPPTAPTVMLIQSGDGQAINQHDYSAPFTVLVADALGNGVPGVAVSFAAASGSGYLTPRTVNTNADGVAAYAQYIHFSGSQRVEATVTGLPAVTFDISVAANSFDFDGYYACHAMVDGNPPGFGSSPFQIVIDQNVATGSAVEGNARPMTSITFNPTTGAFTGWVQFSLDYTHKLTGTMSIDADHKGSGAGTSELWENIHLRGTGTWGCDRY